MKNINNDHNPTTKLEGRLFGTMEYFLENEDCKGKVILNIGCGFGWFELHAIKKGAKKIVGIEITEEDLRVAKNKVKHKNVHFKVGSAIDLPFKDNSFDSVVSWEVIEHIPKNTEAQMFKEIARVLKPKGKLFISTPSNHLATTLLDPAWWLIGHRHYSVEKLQQLAGSNLRLASSELKGKWWTVFGLLNMYVAKWIFRRKPFFSETFSRHVTREYTQHDGFANVFMLFVNEKSTNEKR
jgi:ubiquinone/menaquinone biosynthesis C-methylase UbiE